jgi:hypothetical protein
LAGVTRTSLAALFLVVAAAAAGCGSSSSSVSADTRAAAAAATCPKAWRAEWQRLADRVKAPVYCPSWMPDPLDAKIRGRWFNGESVDPDRSYLVSFLWQDREAGGGGEVHVNFRGYPGQTSVPRCEDTLTVKGKTVRRQVPCFSDPRGRKQIGAMNVTVYTANQGADQWHVLYAWHRQGGLYTVSEHVAPPFSFQRVVQNLERMLRGLVVIPPSA